MSDHHAYAIAIRRKKKEALLESDAVALARHKQAIADAERLTAAGAVAKAYTALDIAAEFAAIARNRNVVQLIMDGCPVAEDSKR